MRVFIALVCVPLALLCSCSEQNSPVEQPLSPNPQGQVGQDRGAPVMAVKFKNTPTDVEADEKTVAEIQGFFDKLGEDGRDRDRQACLEVVHFEFLVESISVSMDEPLEAELKEFLAPKIREIAITDWFQRDLGLFEWQRTEVISVDVSRNGSYAHVYNRHHIDNFGTCEWAHWHMARTPDGWMIYDYQYVSNGMRYTTLLTIALSSLVNDYIPAWISRANDLEVARVMIMAGMYLDALKLLRSMESARFPDELEAVRLERLAFAYCGIARYKEALEAAERALEASSRNPEAHFNRGLALDGLKRHADACEEFQWYIDNVGADPVTREVLADAQAAMGDKDAAIATCRASLKDVPNPQMLVALARLVPPAQYDGLKKHLLGMRDIETSYAWIASRLLLHDGNVDVLDAINKAYKETGTEDPQLTHYQGQVLSKRGRHEEAVPLLEDALHRAGGDNAPYFRVVFYNVVVQAGKAVEVMIRRGNTEEDFLGLANSCTLFETYAQMYELCEAWKEDHPENPALFVTQAKGYTHTLQMAEGEAAAREGLKHAKESKHRGELERMLVTAMYFQGTGEKAYEELGKTSEAFGYLANLYASNEKIEPLRDLIYRHSLEHRNDPVLNLYRGDLALIEENWEEAGTQFAIYLVKQKKANPAAIAVDVREKCVRAYIRADNLKLADSTARGAIGGPDYYLLTMVYTALGHAYAAEDMIDAYIEYTGDVEQAIADIGLLYWDKDCAEPMRSKDFKSIQNRIPIPPRPADSEVDDDY